MNRRPIEVKKKVWSVDATPEQQQINHHTNGNGYHSANQQQNNSIDVSKKNSALLFR